MTGFYSNVSPSPLPLTQASIEQVLRDVWDRCAQDDQRVTVSPRYIMPSLDWVRSYIRRSRWRIITDAQALDWQVPGGILRGRFFHKAMASVIDRRAYRRYRRRAQRRAHV